MGKLFALFTLIPIVEVYLLYALGDAMGFWPTVALVLLTAGLGAALGKREGLRVWRAWRDSLARGQMPEEGVIGGLLVLIGGVLLITPGVLSDLTGLVLLFPPSRRLIGKLVQKRLEKRIAQGGGLHYRVHFGPDIFQQAGHVRGRGAVIETEGEVVEERRRNDAHTPSRLR